MKLITALELANECGLQTVGEALQNVWLHSSQLFIFERSKFEYERLLNDWDSLKRTTSFDGDSSVLEVLMWLRKE